MKGRRTIIAEYTRGEEAAMRRAIQASAEFMAKFGKGRKPRPEGYGYYRKAAV